LRLAEDKRRPFFPSVLADGLSKIDAFRTREAHMPVINTQNLDVGQPLPGWHDRYFRSADMSFAYYDVDEGASIHEHWHSEEEVWHVIEGTLQFTLDGEPSVAGQGAAAIVPSNTRHSVKALSKARVIIANHPVRERIVRHG
jgi:quercetin dioxygenase-like cupin family protein